MPDRQVRASTVAEAFWTLDPFSIVAPGDAWHTDIEALLPREHYGLVAKVVRRLRPSAARPEFVHMAVVGHSGSGKTTLLRTAMDALREHKLEAVYVDALGALDQAELSFSDLILVIAQAVLERLAAAGADLPRDSAEHLKRWFAEELLIEEHRRDFVGAVEAEAGSQVAWLLRLVGKLAAVLRSSNSYRTEIRRRAERDAGELLRRANLLLDGATAALSRARGAACELVVVFDNLEKLADPRIDSEVLRRAEDLRRLRCHLVLFVHPRHEHAPLTVQASQAFDLVAVPMLPLREPGDPPDSLDPQTLAAVRALLERRLDLERVLAPVEVCLRALALWSGGRLRDLLHVTRAACERADPGPVTPEHVAAAARKLSGERATLTRSEHWPRLAEIHRSKQVFSDALDSHLMLHGLVLNYDEVPWWDAHPLLRLDRRFEVAWRALSASA